MGAIVPNKYALEGELDPERFGDSLLKAKGSDGRAYCILRLPRASLALHADWQQQVQNAVQLRHPHIMQVHEMFLDDQYLNVVLDGCTGGSLQQYVQGKQQEQDGQSRLTEERARWLFQQLVLALEYLHSMHVSGLNLHDMMVQAPATNPQQKMVRVCCPLIKLTGSLPCSTTSRSSWLPAICESEQLADIAACGVVLLNMLGGRLKECSWGYNSSTSPDMPSTSSGASAAASVRTSIGASAVASASAEAPYLLPADYTEVLTIGCQQLLQRLLSPNPLGVVLSAAELLQDSWVQHNLTPAAASLNHKCRGMRPLWKEAEQQLPGILAAAASTKLGFKVWQHLTDMQEELEGGWQQQLDASLFGCSNASVAVYAAQDSQQQRSLWACSLLLQGPACAGRDARSESQLAEHAGGMERPGAPAGLLRQPEPPQLLRDQDQQQDQQHQELPQQHVHDQQSTQQHWPTDNRELEAKCRLFTRVPSPGFMAGLQQLYAGQGHPAGSSGSSSGERTAGPVAPVVGMCLQPPVLLLEEPRHGTLASWLAKQQQETEQELPHPSLSPAWPVLQQLLLDVAAGLQALHSQDPPLVHCCVNAGAVHLLQPLPTQPVEASSRSAGLGSEDPQWSMLSGLPLGQQPQQQQQQQVAQLSLLWPWRQAVSRTRSAHPWLSAPEVLQQAATPTPASDVYGLGVLMLQLLTGWVPGVSKAAGAGAAVQQSSGWSLDSPVPGAALGAAVEATAWSGNQQGLQQLCADLEAVCGLSWRIFPKGDSSSSSSMAAAATAAAVGLPAGFLGLMWACLSESPAARPSLAQVVGWLEDMEGPTGKATTSASGTLATDLSMPSRADAQQPSTSAGMGPGSAAGSQAACSGTGPAAQHLAACTEPAEATEAAADSKAAPHNDGGAAALVKLLGSTVGAATKHNAARALAHMTANSAADRAAVVAAGGAAAFVKLLGTSDNHGLQLTAVKALLNLAAGEAASHGALLEAGAIANLLKLLKGSSDAAVQQQAASALAELACRGTANHAALHDAGAPAALAELMYSSPDAAVQRQAATAAAALGGINAAAHLVNVLNSSSCVDEQCSLAMAVAELAVCGAASRTALLQAGAVAGLLKLLKSSSDAGVQQQAARALAELVCRDAISHCNLRSRVEAQYAMAKLLNNSSDAFVQLHAARVVVAAATDDAARVDTVSDAGGVAALVQLLEGSSDTAVQVQAARGLANIATREDGRGYAGQVVGDAVIALVKQLSSSADAAVQLQAATALADFLEVSAGSASASEAFLDIAPRVLPVKLDQQLASAAPALVRLSASSMAGSSMDSGVQLQACRALAGIMARGHISADAVSSAGGAAVLERLLNRSADVDLQLMATKALRNHAGWDVLMGRGGRQEFYKGIGPPLPPPLRTMVSNSADVAVQRQAASPLADPAAGGLSSRAALCGVGGGGVAALVAALNSNLLLNADAAVQLQAASALAGLAAGDYTSRAAVCDGGGVAALVAVLNSTADADVQLQVASALADLIAGSPAGQAAVCDGGGVAALVAVLNRSVDADVQLQALTALSTLVDQMDRSDQACALAAAAGGMLDALRNSSDARVQARLASIIADLAASNKGCRRAIDDAGGVTVFKRLLRSKTAPGVQEQAERALEHLPHWVSCRCF